MEGLLVEDVSPGRGFSAGFGVSSFLFCRIKSSLCVVKPPGLANVERKLIFPDQVYWELQIIFVRNIPCTFYLHKPWPFFPQYSDPNYITSEGTGEYP